MIELICIWCFGRSMYETAKEKGRNGWLWALLIIPTWFSAQIIGALLTIIGWKMFLGSDPNLLVVYLVAAGSAFTSGFLLGVFLDGRRSLRPPELASIPLPPTHAPARSAARRPPPAPRPTVPVRSVPIAFKFHCPHCEQHISTTSDQAGTAAECPACGNALTVPEPVLQQQC